MLTVICLCSRRRWGGQGLKNQGWETIIHQFLISSLSIQGNFCARTSGSDPNFGNTIAVSSFDLRGINGPRDQTAVIARVCEELSQVASQYTFGRFTFTFRGSRTIALPLLLVVPKRAAARIAVGLVRKVLRDCITTSYMIAVEHSKHQRF